MRQLEESSIADLGFQISDFSGKCTIIAAGNKSNIINLKLS